MAERDEDKQGLDPADRELMQLFLDGDSAAIATVRSWVRGQLVRSARIRSSLEDLEQDVLVDLLETLETGMFRGESRLETFVRSFSRFKSIDLVRSAARREMVPLEDRDFTDRAPSPAEFASRRNEVEVAKKILAEMGEDCRKLWGMVHEGLSYGEMSRRLGLSEGALRVRMHRCRKKAVKLREHLAS